ncbi:conserved hypothetical protein [Segniliparus rotundus DSM 44985]|uniref:DUF3263 domain-containing protein n=2 Tax=Segniliparus rotundus TaxID=286802 RepID=D6ZAW3_SEGRD|nr:conserved hypothetical protein [Segniliparus rotundus DSM 44985]
MIAGMKNAFGLDPLSADRLAFERLWFKTGAGKESAIRARFGESPVAYFQALNRLLDDPAAYRADPVLVKRLRRLRSARERVRRAA